MDSTGPSPTTRLQEAREARAAGDRGRALALTQDALRQNPRSAEGLVLYSDLLLDGGADRRLAVRSLETALQLDGASAEAMVKLAELYRACGLPSRAARLLARARELDPRHRFFLAEARHGARASAPPTGLVDRLRSIFNGLLSRMK